jgi:beta-lactamase superfamily II metal-dependent hydrolase
VTRHAAAVLITVLLMAGCGSDDTGTGTDTAPVISVAGILDGASYDEPVAVVIAIDRGAYQATLDGAPFASGDTVRTPGAHTLSVTAHVGAASITRELHFTLAAPTDGVLIIRMLNLGANDAGGGGDAVLLSDSSSAGRVNVLIDAGPSGANASDPGFVARQLALYHVDTLALLLLTHAHDDHYGGMGPVLSAVKVQRFVYNGQVRSLASYNAVVSQARTVADSVIVVGALRTYTLGQTAAPAQLTILPPLTTWLATSTDDGDELNDGSVGARLDLGRFSMLFTGDGEVGANQHWMTGFASLIHNITVLKVGHHGANNAIFDDGFSGTSTWLTKVAPRVSLISGNGTTHPRVNALARLLLQPNDQTWCTNVHGTITVRVDRTGAYTLSVEKNADKVCVPGTEATT